MTNLDHFPNESSERGQRLIFRVALYAGAMLLVAAVAIALLIDREAAGRAGGTVANQTRAVVSANLNSHLRPSDLEAPVTRSRRVTLDRLFRHSALLPGVADGRLIGLRGTITYAANHAVIGTRVRDGAALRRALAGSPTREVTRTVTWRGEKNLKVLRSTVPVRLEGHAATIGALQLDQDYRAVAVSTGDAYGRLALILGLALLAMFISLLSMLHRRLEERNRRLGAAASRPERLLEAGHAARGNPRREQTA